MTFEGEVVSKEEAWSHLESLEGVPLVNDRSRFVAVINNPQRKELTDINKAKMSAQNGFSVDAHYTAVSRIEKLFKYAIPSGVYPDLKHGDDKVKIRRFACPIMIKGEKAVAWLTAKQTTNVEGRERLYNLELVDIEMLADLSRSNYSKVGGLQGQASPHSASKDIMAEIMDSYKTYFGESNFSLEEAKGLGLKSHGPEGSEFSVDEGEVVTRWVSELKGYLGRKIESGSPAHTRDIVVCPAPAVLQMALKNRYDVVITGGVIDKVMGGRHAVSQGEMEQLPMAIADPIGIMKSNTVGSVEILTVLKEGDKNILVAIAVGSSFATNRSIKVNRITSLYGKDKIDELLKHKALYWNKGKARYALSDYRLQLPATALVMRASGKNVPDKEDLVKYKKENGFNFSLETSENRTNFCIIGEGSEIFREYEEAGLVYVDKADGKKK